MSVGYDWVIFQREKLTESKVGRWVVHLGKPTQELSSAILAVDAILGVWLAARNNFLESFSIRIPLSDDLAVTDDGPVSLDFVAYFKIRKLRRLNMIRPFGAEATGSDSSPKVAHCGVGFRPGFRCASAEKIGFYCVLILPWFVVALSGVFGDADSNAW
jgi:hypothetical protein